MASVKSSVQKLFPVVPFILVNTITFIPYLVFLNLHTGTGLEGVLPFVLFYTIRMTGVFLLKSFRLGLTALHIQILSLLAGFLGSAFGVLGEWWYPCYFLSAALLGISAAWLPPSNTTIKYQRKKKKTEKKKKMGILNIVVLVLLLGILIGALTLNSQVKNLVIFSEYTLLYLIAFRKINRSPMKNERMDKIDQQTFYMKEFLLFLIYFILLIIIRLARALFNSQFLTIAVFSFSVFLIVAAWYINSAHRHWKLPIWINMLTFINGMCTNFLLLFGTFYTAFYFGNNKITLYLYLPYILGIIASKLFMKYIYRLFSKVDKELIHIFGLIFSLLLLLAPAIFSVGVFFCSLFISGTSSYLNRVYAKSKELPEDQRIIIRYSTQAKGSITHQFLIITGLWIMVKELGVSINTVLQITGHKNSSPQILQIIDIIHYLSIGLLLYLLFFILYERLFKDRKMPVEK